MPGEDRLQRGAVAEASFGSQKRRQATALQDGLGLRDWADGCSVVARAPGSCARCRRAVQSVIEVPARLTNCFADVCLTRRGPAVTLPGTRRKQRIPPATRRTKCPNPAPA